MATTSMQRYKELYGVELKCGALVTVSPDNEYSDEWQGEFMVLSLWWDRGDDTYNITLTEPNDINDCGCDEWSLDDLIPVERNSGQIVSPESKEFQLGVMMNIEREMPKTKRKRTPNWAVVMTYLLGHTSRGGSTSCMLHCQFLGVDPDGFSFSK